MVRQTWDGWVGGSARDINIVAVSEVILLFLPLTESEPGSEGEPRGKEEYTGIKEQ